MLGRGLLLADTSNKQFSLDGMACLLCILSNYKCQLLSKYYFY